MDKVKFMSNRKVLLRFAAFLSIGAAVINIAIVITQPARAQPPQPQTPPPANRNERVYKMGDGIAAPRVISRVNPGYPEEGRAAQIDGSVRLSLVIGADGVPRDINVV